MSIKGQFRITTKSSVAGEEQEVAPWQDNVVLNTFFSGNTSTYAYTGYCFFGTGTAVPTVTDTTLTAPLTTYHRINTGTYWKDTTCTNYKVGGVNYRELEFKFVGTQGAIRGNVSEIGISMTTTPDYLMTKALIKDSEGNPVTLSFGVNDILTVYYKLTWVIDASAGLPVQTTVAMINGVETTMKLYWVNNNTTLTSTSAATLTLSPFILGTGKATNSGINILLGDLGAYYAVYSGEPVDKSIINFADLGTTTLGYQYTARGNVVLGNGSELWCPRDPVINIPEGTGTGTWKTMLFGASSAFNHTESGVAHASLALVFDPPIVKGTNDTFKFSNLSVGTTRGVS